MKTLPSRSRRMARELLDLFAKLLRPEVSALLDALQAELASPARSRTRAARDCCLESMNALRLRREEFFPALVDALDQGLAEVLVVLREPREPRVAVAASSVAPAPLRLLDDEAMDEEGALAAIAARHEHRASLSLLLLGQRFGVLLASPPLPAAQLPVGPHALGKAMSVAARRIGLCLEARMTLYHLHDLALMDRYPGIVEALDAHADRAGVLSGLAFVPLRPIAVASHGGRGRASESAAATQPSAEADAARVVNDALDALRKEVGTLPDNMVPQRNQAVSVMARILLRHGRESSEWQQCMRCARAIIEATRQGQPAPAEVRAWMEDALRSIGYSDDDSRALVLSITSVSRLQEPAFRAEGGGRTPREQRCLERLEALPLGTALAFSTGSGGFTRSRVRYHYVEPRLLLLANEADGQEGLFEIDAIARQMAAGQAWVIRHPAAVSAGEESGDRHRVGGVVQHWPRHIRGATAE